MSKIGRQPIPIPQGVAVEVHGDTIKVSGSRGSQERIFSPGVKISKEGDFIKVISENSALWGTWRAHIANMVRGVCEGFEKGLEIHGVGYRVALQESKLVFQIGFSHPVSVALPEGITSEIKENTITVRGIDKEKVGQFAASLRSIRPPDSYKGKGIRYQGEVIKLKPGKKAGVGAA
ncbi:MAG: 50S ribosomal protein L6 [Candidatus Portnoybacteria bacterium]|nr:50S ribosomal protein L6 [Candidatus Portnoybacteria bacterium]